MRTSRNKKYWAERAVLLESDIQNLAGKAVQEIVRIYERAINNLNEDIDAVFKEFARFNGLTEVAARELIDNAVNDAQYEELLFLLEETTDEAEQAEITQRINAQAYGARMNRLEAIKQRVYIELRKAAAAERVIHREIHTSSLLQGFYTTIHDTAQGLNCGIDFSLLPKRAINEALNEQWLGSNFSSRIWKNNSQFIKVVQQAIEDGITAGYSVDRIAQKLTDYVNSEDGNCPRYVTERLVRAETAHFMAEGQAKAYEEIGSETYRFLASLSERTCEACGALDNQTFKLSEREPGVNYPIIHPNCRCVTIIGDFLPKTRLAKDPLDGHNYKVDGSMTYEQWKNSLTPEQKEAMELHVKQMRNRSADKAQYERYKNVLGTENISKTLEKFVEIKYNNRERYTDWKSAYRYISANQGAEYKHYSIFNELKKAGINNGVVLPPENVQAYILKDENTKKDPYHIMHRMKERNITDDELRAFKDNATIMFSQWGGNRKAYYSYEGVSVITRNPEQWVFKTAWKKEDFDEKIIQILKVVRKYEQ